VDQYLPHRPLHDPRRGFNASGYGKHNGFEVIREYSRLKSVLIDYSGVTQDAFIMRVN
jgi:(Z)-2-((N-methylformamido)methylene)-5-hydroxybutyrolactone dehydrogenase